MIKVIYLQDAIFSVKLTDDDFTRLDRFSCAEKMSLNDSLSKIILHGLALLTDECQQEGGLHELER